VAALDTAAQTVGDALEDAAVGLAEGSLDRLSAAVDPVGAGR
jgi:hypothetical protein